jgi:hypothetical protein
MSTAALPAKDGHYPVKHLRDPRRREAEIAVPTVPYRRNQSRLGEFRQMRAGCLRRNTRSIGQFGRCKSAAIEKRREHGRSCRLSDQPGNLGYQWPGNHMLNVQHPVRQGIPVDAPIIVEVLIGASDRFGGKIAAKIWRPSRRPAKPACTPAAGRGLSAGAKSLRK